jgi:hypothetical protein
VREYKGRIAKPTYYDCHPRSCASRCHMHTGLRRSLPQSEDMFILETQRDCISPRPGDMSRNTALRGLVKKMQPKSKPRIDSRIEQSESLGQRYCYKPHPGRHEIAKARLPAPVKLRHRSAICYSNQPCLPPPELEHLSKQAHPSSTFLTSSRWSSLGCTDLPAPPLLR